MDNRNRDRMSKDSEVSRKPSDSSQFGSKIGQSEGLGSSSGRNRNSESSESSDLGGDRGRGSSSGSERH